MPDYHGDFSISTSNLLSIQQSIFKLQQQVAEFAASNKSWKIQLAALQQSYNAFIEEEKKKSENPEIQDQELATSTFQDQEELAPAEIDAQNSTITIQQQQTQIQMVTEMQQKIQKSTNAITTKAEQQHQYQSMKIPDQELSLQDQQKNNTKSKIKDLREANLDLLVGIADLRSCKIEVGKETNGAEVGAFVTGGVSARSAGNRCGESGAFAMGRETDASSNNTRTDASNISNGAFATIRSDSSTVEDQIRGGSMAGACVRAAAEKVDGRGRGATSIGDGRTRSGGWKSRRVLPVMAKPPALMAAVFPWDRRIEISVPEALCREIDLRSGEGCGSWSSRGSRRRELHGQEDGGDSSGWLEVALTRCSLRLLASDGVSLGKGRGWDVGLGYGLVLGLTQILKAQIKKKNIDPFKLDQLQVSASITAGKEVYWVMDDGFNFK